MMGEPVVLSEEDYRELAAYLEEQLPRCATGEEGDELRLRLVRLYTGPLNEPLRAVKYVEELLVGIEALVAKEPGDDELRHSYIERARSLGVGTRAAETLGRALKKVKAANVRERVGFDIGSVHRQQGDLKQARSAYLEVVLVGAGGPFALSAARHLLDPELHSGDAQVIATALETVAKADERPADRHEAAEKLLSIHESKPLKESRLLVAYQALVDSPRAEEALGWLRAYYERKGDHGALAEVYRRQALCTTDPAEARALALRSLESSPLERDEDRIEQWLWFLREFGPDARAHASVIPLLERAQRWDDLCRVLEADVELATPEQRAPRMARVGQTRLVVLADTQGALSAFRRCLSLDPWNELARTTVEGLMAAGDSRLAAADVLEPVYRVAKFHEGELRVLETRAELLADPAARLAALAAAVDIAKGKLNDARRALPLCERAIHEAFAFAGETVLDWVVRLERVAALARQPEMHGAILLRLLGDGPLDSAERMAVALSAIDALVAAGAPDQALALCERGLASDPSSPELLGRVDALRCDQEAPDERLARYEAALRATNVAARRRSLMHTIATLRRDSLGDPAGAIAVWRSIVAEDPQDFAAYESLIDTTAKLGDVGGALDLIDLARRSFQGASRHQLTLRKALMLVAQGAPDRALDLCRELVEKEDVAPAVLQSIARLAEDEDDELLYGRALKKLIVCDDAGAKRDALERYGEFLSETVGNSAAAAECWRTAAQMAGEEAAEQQHARALYERVLEVQPDDVQAASQLIELYAGLGDWERIPRALQALIRGDDPGHCALLLLRLEASAVAGRALDEFLSLADELMGRLAAPAAPEAGGGPRVLLESPEQIRALSRAKARVLGCHPVRRHEASAAYRALIETFGSEDDARDFAAHIEATSDAEERHQDVRWLYRWRAGHTAPPGDVLLEWARAEEAHGDSEAAAAVYQRLLDAGGERKLALQALVRLQVRAGALDGIDPLGARLDDLERVARDLGSMETVARAYHDVLVNATAEPSFAEMLGRRIIAVEEECALDSSQLIEALYRVLDLVPGARWALDRVKLALGTLARWDDLFNLFDRAIGAAPDEHQRAELLHEAASAARDLAGEPQRAIAYFESLRVLRPDDTAVEGALERLYEKQGRSIDLLELLGRRLERASGFRRRDLSRRVASLWLDLGDVGKASAIVEEMLRGEASAVDAIDLLERIVQQPAPAQRPDRRKGGKAASSVHERAIARLRDHYESIGRLGDVIRMAERSLALASTGEERARCVRDLVGLQFRAAGVEGAAGVFERVGRRLEAYLGGEARLVKVANRAILIQAVRALKADLTPSERADAREGAWAAIQSLLSVMMDGGDAASALRLLERCARLPLEPSRRREILGTAAFVCSEYLRDSGRAIGIFARLFDEDAGDDIAAKSLERFSTLLDAMGRHAELANLWERQADVRARGGDDAEEAACWQRAALLWERQGAMDQAIHAYRRAAAVGGETSFEALARIHADRGEWADACRALEWLCTHAPAGARGQRALRLTEAYVRLGDRPRARACLEETLRLADGYVAAGPFGRAAEGTEDTEPVRKRLIDLYREDQVWRPLARLLSAEAEGVDDPGRKLPLLREAADLHRHRLDEPSEAAVLLEQAVSLDPHDGALRASLLEILETLQQWDRMVAILREQIDLFGDHRSKDRALTHHRLAGTLLRANSREEALGELRLAAEMNPTHPGILHDLARVALDLEQLDLSERTYRALLLAVHRPTETSPSSAFRADIFVDLSEIAVRRGDFARAADLVDSAIDEAVERGEDPQRFEQGLRARGRDELLARALERRVQRGTTLTERAVALGELARLWNERLERPSELGTRIREYAERIARDLSHEERTDASAWAALSAAYATFGGTGPLAAILTSAIPRIPAGAERSRLRVMLARTLLEEPGRLDAAVNELSKALAEEPAGSEPIDLLSQVLERQGRFDALVNVWEKRLGVLSPGAGAPEVADATWHYARALELAGRVNDAVPIYESLVDLPIGDREIARALANRLGELRSDRLGDALECWMRLDVDSGAEVAKRLAALRESRGDAAGAVRALEHGFSGHPEDSELRDRLVKSYERRAEWGQAARVLDVAVAARPDDAELLVARSAVRERSSDHEGALTDLERACAINSAHVNALVELFARATAAVDADRAGAYTIRLVDVLLRVNRPKQARRELERLLARNPNHREALARLASAAATEGHWKSAAETYRKLLAMILNSSSPEELARVAVATADACERAGVLGEARESLARVVDVVSESPGLLSELERLSEAMKDWPRLARTLLARAEREEAAEARADLFLRAGQMLLDEANDPAGALPLLDRVLEARPDSVEARLPWARAQVALGRAPEALKLLYETLEKRTGKRATWVSAVYLEIGKAHLAVDELSEALFALESGFSADWRTGDIAMQLGLVALDLGEEKTAERAFSAVTSLPLRKGTSGPAGADAAAKTAAYCHLAALAMGKGDFEKARRLAGKALGGEPGNVAARALLERLDSSPVASVS